MGEIFCRTKPLKGLAFTGERLTSELGGQTEIEHLHRYMFAREFCRGRDVLDVASGEGYGSALIAQVANSVVGVEVADDVVAHAAGNYPAGQLRFLQGDARAIPIGDGTVDVVISFETIEHFDGHDKFLSEVRRVLRPGGVFIVSTPDRDNYSPADCPANPYHVFELTQGEFSILLKRHFPHVAMGWQRAMIGSALLPGPESRVAQETVCFERRGDGHFEASRGYARPQYLVALCSDEPLPPLPASIYIESGQLYSSERATTEQLRRELEALSQLYSSERATTEQLRRELEALHASSSWRLTAPLRAVRRLFSTRVP
jgi:SAM-dependent methyltransferase